MFRLALAIFLLPLSVTAYASDYSALAARVIPATVRVIDTARTQASGSGVIIAPRLVLTALHVVSDPARITVELQDGRKVAGIGIDRDQLHDLALISIEAADLRPAVMGHGPVRVGEEVIAVGYPLGLSVAVTTGHLSAIDYSFGRQKGMLLVDAPINPGNSGGPLFDSQGSLIGICARTVAGTNNLGLFVAVDNIHSFLRRNGWAGT